MSLVMNSKIINVSKKGINSNYNCYSTGIINRTLENKIFFLSMPFKMFYYSEQCILLRLQISTVEQAIFFFESGLSQFNQSKEKRWFNQLENSQFFYRLRLAILENNRFCLCLHKNLTISVVLFNSMITQTAYD